MPTEVKFTIPVPALDALRRIIQRDFLHDAEEHKRIMQLPEKDRTEPLRRLMRNESDRGVVERTIGFDGSKNERGE